MDDKRATQIAAVEVKKEEIKKRKDNIEYLREKDREKVKGVFRYFESPGATLSFPFKKYKKDPVEIYHLIDGQTYELPLGVAKHLNNNGWYPIHVHRIDDMGNAHPMVGKKVKRFGFDSLEFMDVDGLERHGQFIPVQPDIVITGK